MAAQAFRAKCTGSRRIDRLNSFDDVAILTYHSPNDNGTYDHQAKVLYKSFMYEEVLLLVS